MMYKAIRKALDGGMPMRQVQSLLSGCGYDLTMTTEVCQTTLKIMTEDPPDPNEICPGSAEPLTFFSSSTTIDGADFFDMAKSGVGLYQFFWSEFFSMGMTVDRVLDSPATAIWKSTVFIVSHLFF